MPSDPGHVHRSFLRWAAEVSLTSLDPRTKVGAVLRAKASEASSFLTFTGVNQLPGRLAADPEVWNLRLSDDPTMIAKHDAVIHAELDVLMQAGPHARGGTLYVTIHPCYRCAAHIAHAGIRHVIYQDDLDPTTAEFARPDKAALIFQRSGVILEKLT